MGVSLNAQENDSEYIRNLKELAPLISDRFFSPIKACDFTYKLTRSYQEEQKKLKVVQGFTKKVIAQRKEERKKQIQEKEKPAFLDMLLKLSEEENNVLSDLELQEEVDTFMFAVSISTANTSKIFPLFFKGLRHHNKCSILCSILLSSPSRSSEKTA